MPGFLNDTAYAELAARNTTLFRKIAGAIPVDWTWCDPSLLYSHTTVSPTATVSTAGFWLPLWARL